MRKAPHRGGAPFLSSESLSLSRLGPWAVWVPEPSGSLSLSKGQLIVSS